MKLHQLNVNCLYVEFVKSYGHLFLIHSFLCKLKLLCNRHYTCCIMDMTGFDKVVEELKYWKILVLKGVLASFTVPTVIGLLEGAMIGCMYPP